MNNFNKTALEIHIRNSSNHYNLAGMHAQLQCCMVILIVRPGQHSRQHMKLCEYLNHAATDLSANQTCSTVMGML